MIQLLAGDIVKLGDGSIMTITGYDMVAGVFTSGRGMFQPNGHSIYIDGEKVIEVLHRPTYTPPPQIQEEIEIKVGQTWEDTCGHEYDIVILDVNESRDEITYVVHDSFSRLIKEIMDTECFRLAYVLRENV